MTVGELKAELEHLDSRALVRIYDNRAEVVCDIVGIITTTPDNPDWDDEDERKKFEFGYALIGPRRRRP